MLTRRGIAQGASALVAAIGIDARQMPVFAAGKPSSGTQTPDGYSPPIKSRGLLKGVRFDRAARVGVKYTDRFKRWDDSQWSGKDPNLCKGMYEIPNGKKKSVLYWDAKMALDADGASEAVCKQSSGASKDTSYHFKDGTGLNAEIVPYFVAPTFDDPAKVATGKPWEGSGDRFVDEFKLRAGNLGVVIFESKIAGAIFADEGPAMKIGEASIRVHELIRHPPLPWKGDPADKILIDASEDKNVLYLVFRDTFFDVDAYGADKQKPMAVDIQKQALAAFADFKKAQG